MGQRKEQVYSVELYTIDFGAGSEFQHCVQIDRRLGVRTFADESRPHRIVKSRRTMSWHDGSPFGLLCLENQNRLLGFELCRIDTRNLLKVLEGLEWPVFGPVVNEGGGFRTPQAQPRFEVDCPGLVDVERRKNIGRIMAREIVEN